MRNASIIVGTAMLCLVSVPLQAQDSIPNGDFEAWQALEPTGWSSSNYVLPASITQSGDAHSGVLALQGRPIELTPGVFASPFLQTQAPGFPLSQRWSALSGFYKLTSVGQDALDVTLLLYRNGSPIGTGYFTSTSDRATYTEFKAEIVYGIDSIPDIGFIFVSMRTGDTIGTSMHDGSMFLLDDLVLSMDSGSSCPVALTGDLDASGDIKSSDIIYMVNYVLKAGVEPLPCPASGDVNCDGEVKASDIVNLVNYVFKAGTAPCDVCSLIGGVWNCP